MRILFVIIIFLTTNLIKGQENELYLNYLTAVYNESTFQYFTVIKYKNLNTSQVKEVCIQGEDLRLALRKELNLNHEGKDYDKLQEILKNNNERYFEFKNIEAIAIFETNEYTVNQLKRYEKSVSFEKLANEIKKSKSFGNVQFSAPITLHAHALFNRGILTGVNNCISGELHFVDRDKQN